MNEPLTFIHGRFVPQSEAHLAINDGGFIFGATVTDLCRTFRHRLYRWEDHLARFVQSCRSTCIGLALSENDVTERAHELVAHNAALIDADQDLALVMFATPGPVGYYLGQAIAVGEKPTFCMHAFPLPFARYRFLIEHGANLRTPRIRQIPASCVNPHIKQRSRMHWWLAGREVADALLLDMDGHVTETASANFLLVKNGVLIAPPRESVLEGVGLKVLTELCARLGISIAFRNMDLEECQEADEALLTCTSYCLAGVSQINDHLLPWPGPMLQRLLAAWNAEVGLDIHEQIRKSEPETSAKKTLR